MRDGIRLARTPWQDIEVCEEMIMACDGDVELAQKLTKHKYMLQLSGPERTCYFNEIKEMFKRGETRKAEACIKKTDFKRGYAYTVGDRVEVKNGQGRGQTGTITKVKVPGQGPFTVRGDDGKYFTKHGGLLKPLGAKQIGVTIKLDTKDAQKAVLDAMQALGDAADPNLVIAEGPMLASGGAISGRMTCDAPNQSALPRSAGPDPAAKFFSDKFVSEPAPKRWHEGYKGPDIWELAEIQRKQREGGA